MQGDNAGGYRGIQGDTGPHTASAPVDLLEQARRRMLETVRQAAEAQVTTRERQYDQAAQEYERRIWHLLEAHTRAYREALDRRDAC